MAITAQTRPELTHHLIVTTFNEVCRHKEYPVVAEHAEAVARALAADQKKLHQEYWHFVSNWAAKASGQRELANMINQAQNIALQPFASTDPFSMFDAEGAKIVRSTLGLPVLTDTALADMKFKIGEASKAGTTSNNLGIKIVSIGIIAYFSNYYGIYRNDILDGFGTFQAHIIAAAADVSFYRLLNDQENLIAQRLSVVEVQLQKQINSQYEKMKPLEAAAKTVGEVNERAGQLEARANGIEAEIGELVTKHSAAIEQAREDAKLYQTTLREELGLKATRSLWGTRATWAAIGFYISGGLLLCLLLGIPIAAYCFRLELIQVVKEVEEAFAGGAVQANGEVASSLATIGRLLLISAPVGLIVWMIRLVVRYNMRSMLLMDDARQRLTMLDTYLFLVEKDAATKQDRGAVLEALFRRAPGHGPDTAEPPHFTDLLKYGQDGPSKL